MEIAESNKHGPLFMEDLENFEKFLGTRLPEDYRNFLIEHNGGSPEEYLVCWPGSSEPCEVWNDSLGLHNGPTYARLDSVANGLKDYLPEGVLPFASDPGGNHFCIGISGEYTGKIYFWDHEEPDSKKSISLLSDSFSNFIANLVGDEDA
jgi:cell wall assembly regulator SMI1